jgi:prepilin-type N-terminal cleavage/methylation domain-containing protein
MNSPRPTSPCFTPPGLAPRAFTLVELMISIAIALILILGVSRVFSYSTDAVGAGQALVDVSRDARAAAAVFARDLSGAVLDGSPCIIIRSAQNFAFRNKADYQAATNFETAANGTPYPNPQYDQMGNQINPANYGSQSHRQDMFSFFAQGRFRRQTANQHNPNITGLPQTSFAADQTSNQAWIWYGHLVLPDNTLQPINWRNPGEDGIGSAHNSSNLAPMQFDPNNLFASQWILGREAILLQPTDANGMMYDRNGTPQEYLCRPPLNYKVYYQDTPPQGPEPLPPNTQADPNTLLSNPYGAGTLNGYPTFPSPAFNNVSLPWFSPSLYPLDVNTQPAFISSSSTTSNGPQWNMSSTTSFGAGTYSNPSLPLWTSRYDVANTSIAEYRNILKRYIEEIPRVYPGNIKTVDWWDPLMSWMRFYGNPFIQKPLSMANGTLSVDPNAQAAQLAPCFLAGCSQFIVEYAGDYLNQNPATGQVLNTYVDGPTDGQVDFVVDQNGNRQIRWYGLPRAVPNVGSIPLQTTNTTQNNPQLPNPYIANAQNVYPLTDIWSTETPANNANSPSPYCAPFEKVYLPGVTNTQYEPLATPVYLEAAPGSPPPPWKYLNKRQSGIDYFSAPNGSYSAGLEPDEIYTCAWGPYDRKPLMIRITITMEDPNNRLANGQTYQFVFRLGNGNGN